MTSRLKKIPGIQRVRAWTMDLLRSLYSGGSIRIYAVDNHSLIPTQARIPCVVRRVTDAHEQGHLTLMRRLYPRSPEHITGLLTWGGSCYLASSEGTAVGFGWLNKEEHTLDGLGWHEELSPGTELIHSCGVDPAFRGQGVYPALLTAMVQERLENGVREVLAEVDARNTKSIRGLDKVGFRPVRTIVWRRVLGRPHAHERSMQNPGARSRAVPATVSAERLDSD